MEHLESLYQAILPWLPLLTITGILMAITSALTLPWVLVRLPADYFVLEHKTTHQRSLLGWFIWLLRNSLALILFIFGILMLVLPGQGLLTIFISVGISTAPGKYWLERTIIRRPTVFKSVNWIRQRYQRQPMIHPDSPQR